MQRPGKQDVWLLKACPAFRNSSGGRNETNDNDGPLKSNLRFTDMIDIADGTFVALGITPAGNLNGSSPQRSGLATVWKLEELDYLDEDGNMIWPLPEN